MSKKKLIGLHVLMTFKPGDVVDRCSEAAVIANKCPTSALYATVAAVKESADTLKQRGLDLGLSEQAYLDAKKSYDLARTQKQAQIASFDKAAGVLKATVQGSATTPADVEGIGCTLASAPVQVALSKVLSIGLKDGTVRSTLDIHVKRILGLRGYRTQLSVDPMTPTSWTELPGLVAKRTVPNLVRGARYWVRACACRGALSGEWSEPYSFVIA